MTITIKRIQSTPLNRNPYVAYHICKSLLQHYQRYHYNPFRIQALSKQMAIWQVACAKKNDAAVMPPP